MINYAVKLIGPEVIGLTEITPNTETQAPRVLTQMWVLALYLFKIENLFYTIDFDEVPLPSSSQIFSSHFPTHTKSHPLNRL